MDIKRYLDSTYLKTAEQAGLTEFENNKVAQAAIQEAIDHHFKLIMIRPEQVATARQMVDAAKSAVVVGTVIDFPLGNGGYATKMEEAIAAVENGADELDFVIDYRAYQAGEIENVRREVIELTRYGLSNKKVVKWIIETAALTDLQIAQLSALVKNVVLEQFDEADIANVFVKSSTGFFKTPNGEPNGATPASILLMLENAAPLPVKASGGVRTYEEAKRMIQMGVKRIGTSSAKAISEGKEGNSTY